MSRSKLTPDDFRKLISEMSDLEVARFHYSQQIGSTFIHLALMEDSIIHSLSFSTAVKFGPASTGLSRAKQHLNKYDALRAATLGNLLKALQSHSVAETDMNYLRWVKRQRDFFVHRLFEENPWPGDLRHPDDADTFIRRLLYLERTFERASGRIWAILERAKIVSSQQAGGGYLVMNPDFWDSFSRDH